MTNEELDDYTKTVKPNFDSHIEKGTIEMSNEYYNLLEEKIVRLINENQELKDKISNMKESYETDAEAKFYDYLDKYKSKKPLAANDYVELNKNNKILMSYNQTLLKEKQELKKQVEKLDKKLFLTKNELDMREKTIDNKLTQQKAFIKWLEDEVKKQKEDLEKLCELYKIPKENNAAYKFVYSYINKMEEILQKYKEIIGVSDEKES